MTTITRHLDAYRVGRDAYKLSAADAIAYARDRAAIDASELDWDTEPDDEAEWTDDRCRGLVDMIRSVDS